VLSAARREKKQTTLLCGSTQITRLNIELCREKFVEYAAARAAANFVKMRPDKKEQQSNFLSEPARVLAVATLGL
jgi:hypothetical protein